MPPVKRTRKPVDRFDPHPPGTSHDMAAHRVRKTREKKAERERKRKERGNEEKEAGNDQGGLAAGGNKQPEEENNNQEFGPPDNVDDTLVPQA